MNNSNGKQLEVGSWKLVGLGATVFFLCVTVVLQTVQMHAWRQRATESLALAKRVQDQCSLAQSNAMEACDTAEKAIARQNSRAMTFFSMGLAAATIAVEDVATNTDQIISGALNQIDHLGVSVRLVVPNQAWMTNSATNFTIPFWRRL